MKTWLVDTGPLIAYLNSADPAHLKVATCLDSFSGQLATTSAVITEVMHFVAASPDGPRLFAEFIVASGMLVYDFSQPPSLRDAAILMEKYLDTPMDYADATLVLLADHLRVSDIVTLDRRGFSAYKTKNRRFFLLVLDR